MLYSICIATYKRPQLLEKLLDSLSKQKLPESVELEVIIVDNDKLESAKEVVEKMLKKSELDLRYFTQPIKNISITRNVSVAEAKGECILFIDDDEIASSGWVSHLHTALLKYNADGVFGKVLSYFDEDIPEWLKKSFMYHRKTFPSGTIATYTRTGNCIVKSSLLKGKAGPFDLSYGVSGGEDTYLFGKLRQDGAKFVNCIEAITYEYVPKERATISWQLKRAFRFGNNFARRSIELSKNRKTITRISYFIKNSLLLIACILLAIVTLPFRVLSLHWVLKASANIGKIAAVYGYSFNEYK